MASKMMAKKRVSKVGKKHQVLSGRKLKTSGGLTKADLKLNKNGKVVSKKQSDNAKKAYRRIAGWTKAVNAARKALGVKGFCAVNGKTALGKQLYTKAKSFYRK